MVIEWLEWSKRSGVQFSNHTRNSLIRSRRMQSVNTILVLPDTASGNMQMHWQHCSLCHFDFVSMLTHPSFYLCPIKFAVDQLRNDELKFNNICQICFIMNLLWPITVILCYLVCCILIVLLAIVEWSISYELVTTISITKRGQMNDIVHLCVVCHHNDCRKDNYFIWLGLILVNRTLFADVIIDCWPKPMLK